VLHRTQCMCRHARHSVEESWRSGSCLDKFISHSLVYIVSYGIVFVCPCGMPLWACAGQYSLLYIVLCQGSCKGVGPCTGIVHVPAMPPQCGGGWALAWALCKRRHAGTVWRRAGLSNDPKRHRVWREAVGRHGRILRCRSRRCTVRTGQV